MNIVLCGGGTGGHVYPALAIAEAIHEMAPNANVHFLGTATGFEAQAISQAGEVFHEISAGGIIGKSFLARVTGLSNAALGVWQSLLLLRKIKPNVVIGTGGFVMAPVLLAANWMKIPTIIQEQNSYPGFATRKFARKARAVCLGISGAERHLGSARSILTGNPLRKSLIKCAQEAVRGEARARRPRLFVVGGSLGARSLNNAVAQCLDELLEIVDVTWQYGRSGIPPIVSESYIHELVQTDRLHVARFYEDMHLRYSKADLVVCRAGAMTLAELALFGLPAILVPYPFAAHQHQLANARSIESAGAAIVLSDEDLNGESLLAVVRGLVTSPERGAAMSRKMRSLARPDAARDVAQLSLSHAKS